MPSLTWIGKDAVQQYHRRVPYRLLHSHDELSVAAVADGNLLVEGDNLHALKALLPYYAGKVKCIYIDPPYNTGNEGWVYNDAVNAPEMKAWLADALRGQPVKLDDLSRHDKWLCMMYPRLVLLHELLREDGSLWVSIDDNEVHHTRAILDEVFGERNFVATVIWQKIFAPKGSARHLSANHDFVLLYAKSSAIWERNLQPRTQRQDERYKNPDNDPRGPWASDNLTARNYYSLGTYPITTPAGRIIEGPPKGTYWRVSRETFDKLDDDNRIWWGETGHNMPRLKRFLSEVQEGVVPQTIWLHEEVGNTQEAKKEVVRLLPEAVEVFSTPKPTRLLQRILQIATNPGDLVLDSFAGSGTTGHAVLQLNAQDGGNRRFILVEIEPNIARNITAERLRRAIQGYAWMDERGKEHGVEGLGGGFRFCTLDEPLFDERGRIRWGVSFGELARHIFFTETGRPLAIAPTAENPYIGEHESVSYFLLWSGTMAGILDAAALRDLAKRDGRKVVYAELCRVSDERLEKAGIVYKQIPYSIRTR